MKRFCKIIRLKLSSVLPSYIEDETIEKVSKLKISQSKVLKFLTIVKGPGREGEGLLTIIHFAGRVWD